MNLYFVVYLSYAEEKLAQILIFTNNHWIFVVCVCCLRCGCWFCSTTQYCEQMRASIFTNSFSHQLQTTYKNLHKMYVDLFICNKLVASRQCVGQTPLLKA